MWCSSDLPLLIVVFYYATVTTKTYCPTSCEDWEVFLSLALPHNLFRMRLIHSTIPRDGEAWTTSSNTVRIANTLKDYCVKGLILKRTTSTASSLLRNNSSSPSPHSMGILANCSIDDISTSIAAHRTKKIFAIVDNSNISNAYIIIGFFMRLGPHVKTNAIISFLPLL